MEVAKLIAEKRDATGKRTAARLRNEGKLPGIVYGHKEAAEMVSFSSHEFGLLLQHGSHLVELSMNGKIQQVLIKDVQFNYLGTEPLHVDFVRVDLDEKVNVSVPLEFKGVAKGTQEGGILEHELSDLEIRVKVNQIPELIEVNVNDLGLDEVLHVSDLELPPGCEAVTLPDAPVAAVRSKAAAPEVEEEAVEGEEPEGPEIIGREKKEEEGAEEEAS